MISAGESFVTGCALKTPTLDHLRGALLRSLDRLQTAALKLKSTTKGSGMPDREKLTERRQAPLGTPSDIETDAKPEITGALNALLADVFTLYLKTKNFH